MPDQEHVHEFYGDTSFDYGHSHRYLGYTTPAVETEFDHTHLILVVILVDIDHDHVLEVFTGPGIYTERGHVHRFIGETSLNGRPLHTHRFDNVTSLPPIPYFYSG